MCIYVYIQAITDLDLLQSTREVLTWSKFFMTFSRNVTLWKINTFWQWKCPSIQTPPAFPNVILLPKIWAIEAQYLIVRFMYLTAMHESVHRHTHRRKDGSDSITSTTDVGGNMMNFKKRKEHSHIVKILLSLPAWSSIIKVDVLMS